MQGFRFISAFFRTYGAAIFIGLLLFALCVLVLLAITLSILDGLDIIDSPGDKFDAIKYRREMLND
jgi:hypothetical protein